MRLEHKPGTVNAAADALSRAPISEGQSSDLSVVYAVANRKAETVAQCLYYT